MKVVECYTLFDISYTGVKNRSKPQEEGNQDSWIKKRNSQCNLDTVLQAISIRSQPELINLPEKIRIKFNEFDNFGFLFQQTDLEDYPCWKFKFTVQHQSVFDDGISELGALYNDCHGVPMLYTGEEWQKIPNFLDCSDELKNIYFEVINDI
jgi:hypothetical protein